IAMVVAFLFIPWLNLPMVAGSTGLRLLTLAESQTGVTVSGLFLIPTAGVVGGLLAPWSMFNPNYRRAISTLILMAGLASLAYYGILLYQNVETQVNITSLLGIGFYVGLFAAIGLVVQIFIPRSGMNLVAAANSIPVGEYRQIVGTALKFLGLMVVDAFALVIVYTLVEDDNLLLALVIA